MNTLPEKISTLNARITEISERLAPAQDSHVTEAIRSLLSAGLSLPGAMDAEKAPHIYAFALSKVSAVGVRKAVAKLVRGEYDLRNRSFIPTPPELADLARREMLDMIDDLTRLKAIRASMATDTVSHDEGSKARVRELLKSFHDANEIEKSKAAEMAEPFDEERAEYWRSIMALKDADNVTEEQKQFRRRIAKRVSGTEATTEGRNAA